MDLQITLVIIMKQIKFDVSDFLIRYFSANQCEIKQEQQSVLQVQLTKKMDLALMNRPFYWQYVESTGNKGQPMELSFILDELYSDEAGEWIHFGSPRLEKIFKNLRETSKFVRLYEMLQVNNSTMLHPWLVTNVIIKYSGKQKKEELLSIGLNLINGELHLNMMEKLNTIALEPMISNNCYTISPIIKLKSGFKRIENLLYEHIQKLNHEWAIDSISLLDDEIEMIKHFYAPEDKEVMEQEISTMTNRLEPTICFDILNGGLFYLHN